MAKKYNSKSLYYCKHKLKVGDWVQHKNNKNIYQITRFDRDNWPCGDTPGGGWNASQVIKIVDPDPMQAALDKINKEIYGTGT